MGEPGGEQGAITCMHILGHSFVHVCSCAVQYLSAEVSAEHDFFIQKALTEQINSARHQGVKESKDILL